MNEHLKTYLVDHAAAYTALLELIGRCRKSNEGSDLGDFLMDFSAAMKVQSDIVRKVLGDLDASESTLKNIIAWGVEKSGRLKLNDSILEYSDLSRVMEIEGMLASVCAMQSMWEILDSIRDRFQSVKPDEFASLMKECTEFRSRLKEFHIQAAEKAFSAV